MTKIANCMIVLVVLASALLATPRQAEARSRWRRSRSVRTHRHYAPKPARSPSYSTRYGHTNVSRYDYYPKYTGGFHARYFDGIPSIYGTQTMRGTAW